MAESYKKPARPTDKKANRRGAARLAAVQALYQMDIAGAGINDIFAEFESHWLGGEVEGDKYLPAEAAFFRDIVSGVFFLAEDSFRRERIEHRLQRLAAPDDHVAVGAHAAGLVIGHAQRIVGAAFDQID